MPTLFFSRASPRGTWREPRFSRRRHALKRCIRWRAEPFTIGVHHTRPPKCKQRPTNADITAFVGLFLVKEHPGHNPIFVHDS